MTAKARIRLDMSPLDVVMAMVDGNPGAISVCVALLEKGASIDPDAFMGGVGCLLSLDQLGVYGSRIWMLYKDVCGQDITKLMAVLRAHQLGLGVSAQEIAHAIDNRGDGIDVDAALSAVRAKLPRFATVAQVSP